MFQRFFDETLQAEDGNALLDIFTGLVAENGYDRMVYGKISTSAGSDERLTTAASTYPEDWLVHYVKEGYQHIDPVTRALAISHRPIIWRDVVKHPNLSRRQRKMMQESREAGLDGGVSMPLHGPFGEVWTMTLASSRPGNSRLHPMMLMAASQHFHSCYLALNGQSNVRSALPALTRRELSVLTWAGRGKNNSEIGDILGISSNSVKFHLSNVMTKLGVSNRILAIVTALRSGLIDP
ncbi:MAG: LuxR family transcriptional regulator [Alphaproteobacteria bacterium]|nr:LuxR family transcriptional regulator [Alphaproteobacteria bacterium]